MQALRFFDVRNRGDSGPHVLHDDHRPAGRLDDRASADHSSSLNEFFNAVDAHYVYIAIRMDLRVSHQITQACHAALEAGRQFFQAHGTLDHTPDALNLASPAVSTASQVNLITLMVPDEPALLALKDKLMGRGIDHHLFHEPDILRGCEKPLGFTALATAPICGVDRSVFSRIPLWVPPG